MTVVSFKQQKKDATRFSVAHCDAQVETGSRLAHNVPLNITMSVRITRIAPAIIRISGRLQSGDVLELDKEIGLVNGPFVLDLSELLSADEAGIERLREIATGGVEIRDASHYVRLLLEDGGK